MIWIYKNNDKVVSTRKFEEVKGDYIELERMIPQPNKAGYISVLCADFDLNRVWFKLEPMIWKRKEEKIKQLLEYDSSSEINMFSIGSHNMWLDSSMRRKIKDRLDNESSLGIKETTLWDNGKAFHITLEQGYAMYSALEIYASKCYDVTQQHLANIKNLNSIEEIDAYDYTIGYPEKLTFNL